LVEHGIVSIILPILSCIIRLKISSFMNTYYIGTT